MKNSLFFVVEVNTILSHEAWPWNKQPFCGSSIDEKLKGELHSHVVSFKRFVQTVRNVNMV